LTAAIPRIVKARVVKDVLIEKYLRVFMMLFSNSGLI
jgi:hypothetical protein